MVATARFALAVAALAVLGATPAFAQEPPRPVPAASDVELSDSAMVADSLATVAHDSVFAADSAYYNLPQVGRAGPVGWDQGVWEWSFDALRNSGAVTVADLVVDIPGMISMLAGDFGTPVAFTAFGVGGGRIRIVRDGFEVLPLQGGVTDLARVGLVGVQSVRIERHPGEVVVRMESMRYQDPRAYSVIEAGTGDLNTNLLRGTFGLPRALGGSISGGLERSDSRGAQGNEPGENTGVWLRYQLHHGDKAGLAVDFRRMGSKSDAEPYASPVTRSDLTVRGSARLAPGLVGEIYWGRSTNTVEDIRDTYAGEGGQRSQMGVRTSWESGPLSVEGAYRRFGGDGLPAGRLDLSVGANDRHFGGVSADVQRVSWPETTTSSQRFQGWTPAFLGLSLFGAWESGTAGARSGPVTTPLPPDSTEEALPVDSAAAALPLFRVTDRTATRVGARWLWRTFTLAGARIKIEADSLLPLGTEPDRGGPVLPGGTRTGWEASGSLPTPLRGLSVQGSYQRWDQDWSYLPKQTYQAAMVFHRTYLETGNFEWWWSVGVRGHDPMTVRIAGAAATPSDDEDPIVTLESVPFYQNWYGRMEARIVSVNVFIAWENFAIRRNLQNYPGRVLPITRAVYGIRWTMWN